MIDKGIILFAERFQNVKINDARPSLFLKGLKNRLRNTAQLD